MADPVVQLSGDDHGFLQRWLPVQAAVAAWLIARGARGADAEDLLQEVALAAHASIASYDGRRPFVAWILGIARHKLADHQRRRAQAPTLWSLLDDEAEARLEEAAIAMQEELDERVWAMHGCLDRLGRAARELIDLHYAQDLDLRQIGQRLQLGHGTVKVRLHRLRRALRRCIEGRLGREVTP